MNWQAPVRRDGEAVVIESSVAFEHLVKRRPGSPRFIPGGIDAALRVGLLDRFFDNHVHSPTQKLVADHMRAEGGRDANFVAEARTLLEIAC
jgi:glutathione S-transferase